ncbi:periplasmic nitrate reductase NapA [Deferribacter desulfuricans SSM1]|uniref:Periplasmic nitrate reductase n=1 Tax=Deferribacter desulfuricans (strain DSM 14783 / JCM 11476 / NBRC 101012 / SSM1) TaxID=639282 RepID=D3P985_DEFDS|nr:nitrate reductase [Deferribacter desulfuricans]BAI81275.1 periplasmic nitrate reductase NapA [Deferribacter desulfuricans SSM1]
MSLSRRDFIKLSIASATAASIGLSLPKQAESKEIVDKWVKGTCRFCGTGCGVYVGVKDGKVVAIKGNPDAKTNFGFLCIKGFLAYKCMYHPDRLKYPMIRQKNGRFKKVSWDEALDYVVKKFKYYHKKYGKDSVAYYGSGQCTTEESYTFNKLWKGGFRSNMVEGNPRLCMASAVGGYITTFGSDEPVGSYADIESAKCIFLVGSNTSECHPIIFRRIMRHKMRNPEVKVIVCEPRKTNTAKIADLWLPVDPGTDLAIFHSMAREIIKNNWHDKKFIDEHTRITDGKNVYTFDKYVEFLEQFTPETVEKLSRCPAENIRKAAKWFATSGASMTLWTMGLNQRTRGVWANNLIHNLHLITGNICKPGADSFSLTGQPNACGGVRETGSLAHLLPGTKPVKNKKWRTHVEKVWGLKPGTIDPKPGFHTIKMFGALGGEKDPNKPIKAMLTSTTNPAQSLPNLNKYIKGMKDAFLVVLDIFPTKTTQLADVVLPAAFLYEKGGVFGCSERRSQLTEKAVNPPGEAKADIWIAAQIAKRMGFEKLIPWNMDDSMKANEMAWTDYITVTKDTDHSLWGATYDRLKKEKAGIQWPCPYPGHPGTYKRYVRGMDPMFEHEEFKKFFGKKIPKDAKIYFYMDKKGEGKANIWLRPYKGPAEVPDAEYPFYLTTGRVIAHWHTGTMTMRIPEIARSYPYAYVEIHPDDAKKYNIFEGDLVEIVSRRGKAILPARITKNSLPGILFVPWFDQEISRMINFVCNDAVDPGSKEPEFKIAAVKIRKHTGATKLTEKVIISDINSNYY